MPTVINNPGNAEDSSSNLLVAVILIIVIFGGAILFFVYGLPMIQNSQNPNSTNINVTVPPATPIVPAPAK